MSVLVELPEDDYSSSAFNAFVPAAGFDMGTARAMMWLSQLAYESDHAKIDRIASVWKLDRVTPFAQPVRNLLPMSETCGLIVERSGALIVAFAGTDPVKPGNLVTDLNVAISPRDLHRGFEQAMDPVWAVVSASLSQAGAAGRPILITGHSLGAALAAVTAERAHRETGRPATVIYAYGMPRTGGSSFAQSYNHDFGSVTYRLVHGADVVPSIPPRASGYAHVGRGLHCRRGGTFDPRDLEAAPGAEEPDAPAGLLGEVAKIARDLFRAPLSPTWRKDPLGVVSRLLPPSIGDHLPDRYLAALA
jgi:hypothetical protein